VCVGVADWD